jgi:hypothetical protein
LNINAKDELLATIAFQTIFFDILQILRKNVDYSKCLLDYCRGQTTDNQKCPNIVEFDQFKDDNGIDIYENNISRIFLDFSAEIFADFPVVKNATFLKPVGAPSCDTMVKDFWLIRDMHQYFPTNIDKSQLKKPGSLLRWLFVQAQDPDEQRRLFDKYLSGRLNVYSSSLGVSSKSAVPLLDLVTTLSEYDSAHVKDMSSDISAIIFDEFLLNTMQQWPMSCERDFFTLKGE